MLLEMAADGFGDRVALRSARRRCHLRRAAGQGPPHRRVDPRQRRRQRRPRGRELRGRADPALRQPASPASRSSPMNYRLADEQLRAILARTAPSVVVVEDGVAERVGPIEGVELVTRAHFLGGRSRTSEPGEEPGARSTPRTSPSCCSPAAPPASPRRPCCATSTSRPTWSAPSSSWAPTRTRPPWSASRPYHVAGIVGRASPRLYAGRRVVYLAAFTPEVWVDTARDEAVTQAMVVPTMLGRILDVLEARRRAPAGAARTSPTAAGACRCP